MNKVSAALKSTRNFCDEVLVELKKCAWPTRPELLESTAVVLLSVVILGVFVGLSEEVISVLLNVVIR